jgi:4-amino-4-deoxy-L-arabinose transferase-like glycosyltransferase
MSTIAIAMIAILLITVFVLIVTVFWVKKNSKNKLNKEVDYRAFFIMGISFLPLGIFLTFAVDNPGFIGFIGLGACYIAIGLANKDKWKKEK